MRLGLKGRAARADTRAKERAGRLTRMELQFAAWRKEIDDHAKLNKQTFDEVAYTLRVRDFKSRINAGSYSPLERRALHQLLYTHSQQLIQNHRLTAKPALPPVIVSRSDTRRTLDNRNHVKKLTGWEHAFQARLASISKQDDIGASIWLGLALWSAISRGTLCEADLVKSLRDRLTDTESVFELSLGGQLAIRLTVAADTAAVAELSVGKKQRRANVQTETDAMRVHHYIPDGLTLALMRRWLSSNRHLPDRQKTIVTIRQALWGDARPTTEFRELEHLCRHSAGLIDHRPLPICSEAIGQVASGAWGAMGLDDVSHALCAGRQVPGLSRKAIKLELGVDRPMQKADADWAVHRRLQEAVAREGNRFPSSSDLEVALDSILDICASGRVEHLLVKWFKSLLDNGRKPRTIATYHSRISARVFDGFNGQRLSSLDSADFDLVYREIIDDVRQSEERGQVAGRLAQLHAFGMHDKGYRLPPPTEPLASGEGGTFVRARHIPAKFIPPILDEIARLVPDNEHLVAAVQQGVILAYRGGLRLGEVVKLRLRDIEDSPEQWLFIVQSRFGTNKSPAARRQIPFGVLMNDSEREAFGALRRHRQRSSVEQLLIIDNKSGAPVRDGWLSRTVSLAMNKVLGGAGWTFHHLRHAAANNLFLVLEDETSLATEFSGWDTDQQARIREEVLGDVTARQKRYIALAAIIGHAAPQETFESYIHLIEPVLAARRGRQPVDKDLALYAAALAIAPSRIVKMGTDDNVAIYLRNRLKPWTFQLPRKRTLNFSGDVPGDVSLVRVKPRSPLPEDCRAALEIIERGGSIEEAVLRALVDTQTVDGWVANARMLRALVTKYKMPRLFDTQRLARSLTNPEMREVLLPTKPKSLVEWHDCDLMFAHFRAIWVDLKMRVEGEWALRYLIDHADPGKSGVPFTKPEELCRFLGVFVVSPFVGDRWHLDLSRAGIMAHADWQAVRPHGATYFVLQNLKKIGKGRGAAEPAKTKMTAGHARLYLQHPSRKQTLGDTNSVKRSAPTLRYVPHMLAIMVGLPSSS